MDEALVVSGDGDRIVCSGAATAWHDLALYLIARFLGPATAQAVARFHLLEWHSDGQAAFKVFNPPTDHGDAAVLTAQRFIAEHAQTANPIERMADCAGLSTRTLARRFKRASRPLRSIDIANAGPSERIEEIAADMRIRLVPTPVQTPDRVDSTGEFRHRFKRLPRLWRYPSPRTRSAKPPPLPSNGEI